MRWDRGGHPTRGQYIINGFRTCQILEVSRKHGVEAVQMTVQVLTHLHTYILKYITSQPRCLIHLRLPFVPSVISALPWVSSMPVTVLSLTFDSLPTCQWGPSVVAPDLSSGTPFLQCPPAFCFMQPSGSYARCCRQCRCV